MALLGTLPERANYKLKIDGFHLVGTRNVIKENRKRCKKSVVTDLFEVAYKESVEKSLIGQTQIKYINDKMVEQYKKEREFETLIELANFNCDFTEYILNRLKQKRINLIMRKKRFRDKATLHCWNYFVTQTYDSAKFSSEEDFKKAYLTCLSHLATDFGWRFMGVWERGTLNGRLHFHGVFYIPKGSMKGFFKRSKYFNPTSKRIEQSMINSFFAVRFGRNDFQHIENNISGIASYIIKYIGKTEDKIVYSRHIDGCLNVELGKDDLSMSYDLTYCRKFIVFDDVLSGTILAPDKRRGIIEREPLAYAT